MTKSQLMQTLADKSGLTRKEAVRLYRALQGVCLEEIQTSGRFIFPGIVKLRVRPMKALPSRLRWSTKLGNMVPVPPRPEGKRLRAKPLRAIKVLVGADPAKGASGERSQLSDVTKP
jgi:nucleoid DNA-binding protein